MILNFLYTYSNHIIVSVGVISALVGMLARKSEERDYLIYSDGFQGASVATMFIVAYVLFNLDNTKSLDYLKEKADTLILYFILGGILFIDKFIRSLRK